MYFDAIQDAMKKMNDPATDEKVKRDLQRQLDQLDPDSSIRNFVSTGPHRRGARRPDLGALIKKNREELGMRPDMESNADLANGSRYSSSSSNNNNNNNDDKDSEKMKKAKVFL